MRSLVPVTLCALSVVAFATPVATVRADDLEALESKTALQGALTQIKDLQASLARERKASAGIAAALAESNERLLLAQETSKRAALAAQADLPDSTKALQARLLDALSDLRLAREDIKLGQERQNALVEAVTAYFAADESTRELCLKKLQTQIAAASSNNRPAASPAALERSELVAVKDDQRLLVLNAGRNAGSKVGTPLKIYRNDKPIATAVVVDVRPNVSGALILQNLGNETPSVGDSVRLDVASSQ